MFFKKKEDYNLFKKSAILEKNGPNWKFDLNVFICLTIMPQAMFG